jgi:DNA-binding transcriptional LysR family regulator
MPAGADSSLAILLAHVIKKSGGRDWRRSVAVTTAAAGSLMEQVLAGELDAAIVDVADIPDAFRRVEIAHRPLHLIASMEASRPDDDTLDLLTRTPIGLPMRGTGLRSATDYLLRLNHFAASRSIECGSIPVLMRLVIEGVCCAVLPRSALPVDERRVRAFPLPGPGLVTSLIWTPAKDASPTVAYLRELVKSEPFI